VRLVQELQDAGYSLSLSAGKIVYKWTRPEPPDPERLARLIEELRRQKDLVVEYLRGRPGNCESCPAAGFWDGYVAWGFYPARYCFYAAYFLGKTEKPCKCNEARRECPKKAYPGTNPIQS
jgi:hypothetical protein